ncbi:MAG: hypothetical protein ABIF77_14580 [bacterium]
MRNELNYSDLSNTVNIKYILDNAGNHWICEGDVDRSEDLGGQACVAADEVIYDRGFGG